MGLVDLNDPQERGKTFRCIVVEMERRTKATKTYLGASTELLTSEWSAKQLADLYFERWPRQE